MGRAAVKTIARVAQDDRAAHEADLAEDRQAGLGMRRASPAEISAGATAIVPDRAARPANATAKLTAEAAIAAIDVDTLGSAAAGVAAFAAARRDGDAREQADRDEVQAALEAVIPPSMVGVFTIAQTGDEIAAALVTLSLHRLSVHPDNVRRTGRKAKVDDLIASIGARGLLQNLLVVADPDNFGNYLVKAGGRRLRALQALAKAGTIAPDAAVAVRILGPGDHAAEASLAENLHRVALNPADEILAFKGFVDAGELAPEIALRFGATVRHVEGRLRLANLDDKVMAALRDGSLSLDCAQAFASVDDQAMQAAVLKSQKSTYGGMTPDGIRRAMREKGVSPASAEAMLIGREAYVAAGGRVETDLFTTDATELWLDRAIVDRLAADVLHAGAVALQSRFGFGKMLIAASSWGAPDPADVEGLTEYGRRQDWTQMPDGARAQLVVTARIASDGKVALHDTVWLTSGDMMVMPETDRFPAKPAPDDSERDFPGGRDADGEGEDSDDVVAGGMPVRRAPPTPPIATPPEPEDTSPVISQKMADELAMRRRDVLRLCLGGDYALAADVAAFILADRLVGVQRSYGIKLHGSAITAHDIAEPITAAKWTDELAQHLVDQRDSLPGDWAAQADPRKRFAAFRALQPEQRSAWLAWATAASLTAWENNFNRSGAALHDVLGGSLAAKPAMYWRPTAANYFDRVGKPLCLAMIAAVEGDAVAAKMKNGKKAALAERCEQLAAGEIGDKAVQMTGLQWLPREMMFGGAK